MLQLYTGSQYVLILSHQTDFYKSFDTPYDSENMASLFSTVDPVHHKNLKQGVSYKYSLSALRDLEPQVDECTNLFISIMHEFAESNQVVDFGAWLQWYAFDVMGAITFNRRFGFLDERRDIQNITAGIEGGLWYGSIVGQVPEVHPWLLGNKTLMRILSFLPVVDQANPVPKIVKVRESHVLVFSNALELSKAHGQMVEDAITTYDRQEKVDSRSDFLAWFRKENEKSPGRMSHRDLMNHLMNNL